MTKTDVLDLLKTKQGERSLREFAEEVKCSPAYLSEIYRGTRQPGNKIMRFLGLTRRKTVETAYVKAR